jgi:cobalt-zinc-cadmium resistance protein CzcA
VIAALISASARHRGGVLIAALIAAAIGLYHLVTCPSMPFPM